MIIYIILDTRWQTKHRTLVAQSRSAMLHFSWTRNGLHPGPPSPLAISKQHIINITGVQALGCVHLHRHTSHLDIYKLYLYYLHIVNTFVITSYWLINILQEGSDHERLLRGGACEHHQGKTVPRVPRKGTLSKGIGDIPGGWCLATFARACTCNPWRFPESP